MAFQPGNKEQQKADRKKSRVITQQLISALNEAYGNKTKLRAVIDKWIDKAIDGDMQAINAIADRIDGKPQQSIDTTINDNRDLRDLSGAELNARIQDAISRLEAVAGRASGAAESEVGPSDLRQLN